MERNIAVAADWPYGEILCFAGIIYTISQVFKKENGLPENEI